MTEEAIIELSKYFKKYFEEIINPELKQINKVKEAKQINYVVYIKLCSFKLWYYKKYIETNGLQLKFWEQYTLSKYYLKNCVIENNCDPDFNDGLKEEALYEWLQICVNPHEEVNYDFFFEKYKKELTIDKEQEIKNILFIKEGGKEKLRGLLDNNDWYIRLKTIENWFLKRYDRETAVKIFECRKSTSIDLKFYYPRLIGAIIIGLVQIFFNANKYITQYISFNKFIVLTVIFFALSFFYLSYECYNITNNRDVSLYRSFLLCFFSFVFLSIFLIFLIRWFYEQFYFYNSILFSSAAIFIGIFIQILWEDKTITEPL